MTAGARAERFTPWALVIFALALSLRLLHLWQLRASPFLEFELGDGAVYAAWARRIAAGDWLGSEVFFQSPLYPYFLATVYTILGDDPLLVRGLQCVLSAAACALLASAGASLFSQGAGIVAGLLLATYAPSIFLDALLQKSVFDVFFVCLALWLGARLALTPRFGLAAALGVAVGLLAIARENALILVGVLGVWLLVLRGVALRRRLILAGCFAAGLAAAMLPIALRNFWVGGEFYLTTSQLGMNLYLGNHPGASGLYQPLDPSHSVESEPRGIKEMAERAVGRPLSPQEVSDYWTGQALHYIVTQPADWLRLMLRKLLLLLSAVELVDAEDQYLTAEYSSVLRATAFLGHFGVLAPLAVLGVFVTWPRRREIWWIHAAIAAYAASVLVFYVVTRYRYPLVPFLALLAGAGIAGARQWFESRSRREVAVCAALVLSLSLVSSTVSGMPKPSMAAVTYFNLGNACRRDGQLERAVEHYQQARALDPKLEGVVKNLSGAHLELAAARREQGDEAAALAHYQSAQALAPEEATPLWGAAWIRATEREAPLRSPAEAVALAERAAALTPRLNPSMLETLAAAYAADGRFAEAIAKAREAVALHAAAGRPTPERLADALAGYERGEPLRLE